MVMTEEVTLFPVLGRVLAFLLEHLESMVKLDLIYLSNVTLDQAEDLNMETDLGLGSVRLVLVIPLEE